jgi:hypothetical protein
MGGFLGLYLRHFLGPNKLEYLSLACRFSQVKYLRVWSEPT